MKRLKSNWTIDENYDFLTHYHSPEGIKAREALCKAILEEPDPYFDKICLDLGEAYLRMKAEYESKSNE